ncbi:hypothetical protein NKG05_27910 [Oerskovia sp. M15]
MTLAFAATPTVSAGGAGAQPDERWLDLCAGPGGRPRSWPPSPASGRTDRRQRGRPAPGPPGGAGARGRARGRRGACPGRRRTPGRVEEPGAYDRVLVDAPCTGLGALRRRPSPGGAARQGTSRRSRPCSATCSGPPWTPSAPAASWVRHVLPHLAETQLVVKDVLAGRDDVEVLDAAAAVRSIAGTTSRSRTAPTSSSGRTCTGPTRCT